MGPAGQPALLHLAQSHAGWALLLLLGSEHCSSLLSFAAAREAKSAKAGLNLLAGAEEQKKCQAAADEALLLRLRSCGQCGRAVLALCMPPCPRVLAACSSGLAWDGGTPGQALSGQGQCANKLLACSLVLAWPRLLNSRSLVCSAKQSCLGIGQCSSARQKLSGRRKQVEDW